MDRNGNSMGRRCGGSRLQARGRPVCSLQVEHLQSRRVASGCVADCVYLDFAVQRLATMQARGDVESLARGTHGRRVCCQEPRRAD